MRRKKVKESMNIATAVSFGGSSKSVWKIVLVQSSGLKATVTTMGSVTKDGTTFTPSLDLRRMLRLSGILETEQTKENGNEAK
jgi:hypothetical protein